MEQHEDPCSKYSTVFTNEKAGMQNVDKEKVKKIVYDMSKDSLHFQNEQRKQVRSRGGNTPCLCGEI
jgi:DNA polymerase kappa